MYPESITIEDCLDMYEKKGQAAVIENGQVVKFEKEKQLAGAATPNEPVSKTSLR